MENIVNWLVQQAPVIVVLGLVVYALNKRLEAKEQEIRELNQYVREKTLEMLVTLKDTATILDKVTDGQNELKHEIGAMKEIIMARIDSIKNYGGSK